MALPGVCALVTIGALPGGGGVDQRKPSQVPKDAGSRFATLVDI